MKYKIAIRFYPCGAPGFTKEFEFEFSKSTANKIKKDVDYLPREIKKMLKKDYTAFFEHDFGMDFSVKNEDLFEI